jgi:hypothetical protein
MKNILFFVVLFIVALTINIFNTYTFPIKYAYLTGSILFGITVIWFGIKRPDLIKVMFICGLVGIPFGIMTQYFFYTHDWWLPQTVTNTRVGIEDVIYSFFHGALLSVTAIVFMGKKFKLTQITAMRLFKGCVVVGLTVALNMYVWIFIWNFPSFITTTCVFAGTGLLILLSRPDLFQVGMIGIVGTLGWSMPVFWIANSFFPGWIQEFWINNTHKVTFWGIPLFDLYWYASVGLSGSLLPWFITGESPFDKQ